MILYDWYCNYCHTSFEALSKMKDMQITCPNCGKKAGRCLSTPRIALDGCDPSFTSAWDKWARKHEQAAKIAHKRDDYGGQYNGDN